MRLLVVGLVGMSALAGCSGRGPTQLSLQPLSVNGQQVSDVAKNVSVSSDGTVTGDFVPEGQLRATCKTDARLKIGDWVFECLAGQPVMQTITNGRVVRAINETLPTIDVGGTSSATGPDR
jgi:hypothetical protein